MRCHILFLVAMALGYVPASTIADPKFPAEAAAARASAETASATLVEGRLSREVAFRALENAIAAESDAETKCAQLLREGDRAAIREGRKQLRRAFDGTEDARDQVEEIVFLVEAMGRAVSVAGDQRQAAEAAVEPGEASRASRIAAEQAEKSGRMLSKVRHLLEPLKQGWLVPGIQVGTNSVAASDVKRSDR